jgi:hypothetical protein
MISVVLVCSTLIAAPPAEGATTPHLASYEEARANVGRDADAHVRLALWCEAHGLGAERMRHLAIAVLTDPKHAMARGLMGLVAHRGRWQRPEAVADEVRSDAALEQYKDRRAKAPSTADGQWKLALWCEENGLKAEAVAHLTAVVRLDPSREAAWRRLGYKKQGDRWVTDAQLAEEKAEAGRQKHADRHWKPLLETWRGWLPDKARKSKAEAALAEVTDPRAVPMVWAVFASGDADRQAVAVRVFGQIDSAGASRALATLAVFGKSPEVRRTATETLRRRDVREFADLLIALLRDPIKYEVKPVVGPGSQGELFVEGKKANVKRLYSPPAVPDIPLAPGDRIVGYDDYGLPILRHTVGIIGQTPWIPYSRLFSSPTVGAAQREHFLNQMGSIGLGAKGRQIGQQIINAYQGQIGTGDLFAMIAPSIASRPPNPGTRFSFTLADQVEIPIGQMALEAQKSAYAAQQQIQDDVAAIERINAPIRRINDRVLPVLKEVSDQDLGADREAWSKWWIDQVGYTVMPQKYEETPTIVEQVPLAYQPQPLPINEVTAPIGFRRVSCFGAGTPVHTMSGIRPIETLQEGDQVLTQDTRTGALGYHPILVVHRNPPSATYRIDLGGETIVSSHFHRFWKAGRGWVMARDLKTGDALRTLGGVVKVAAITEGGVQPVFNLDVAEDADFFVGDRGALVHDNTLPDLRLAPFDAPPSLATASR